MTVRPSFNAGRRRGIQLQKGVILDGAFFLLLLTISIFPKLLFKFLIELIYLAYLFIAPSFKVCCLSLCILTLLILYQIIYRSRCQRRNQGRCGRLLTAARQPEPNRLQWHNTPMDLQRQGRRLREIHLRRMLRNREPVQKWIRLFGQMQQRRYYIIIDSLPTERIDAIQHNNLNYRIGKENQRNRRYCSLHATESHR